MGLNLNDKKAVVAEVAAQVANAQTIAIAEYRGIEVWRLSARVEEYPRASRRRGHPVRWPGRSHGRSADLQRIRRSRGCCEGA